jgi:hypothetical protein
MVPAANDPASDTDAIARDLLNLCGAGGVLGDAAASVKTETLAAAEKTLRKFASEVHLPPPLSLVSPRRAPPSPVRAPRAETQRRRWHERCRRSWSPF